MQFLVPVLALVVLVWAVWAIIVRINKRQPLATAAPNNEKLTVFHSAIDRFEWQLNSEALADLETRVLPNFDNPYVAAMDAWVTVMRRFAHPVTMESYSPPTAATAKEDTVPAAKAFGLETVCEFVNEGVVSHDEGRRYFQEILAAARAAYPDEPDLTGNVINFDALLNLKKAGR
jgi:hypothetical protein